MENQIKISSHCTIYPGDNFHNYSIVNCVGKGRYSKVWIGANEKSDNHTSVAIKVYRAGDDNLEEFFNEIKIYKFIKSEISKWDLTGNHILNHIGEFIHIAYNAFFDGRLHPCIVFQRCNGTLSDLIKYCAKEYDSAIPLPRVKHIMRQVFAGLHELHTCNIIHTDIKPSNVLLINPINDEDGNETVLIGDLGGSIINNGVNYGTKGTTQYLAPESIIEMPFSFPIDIWAAFVMCYKLLTGEHLFDIYAEYEISYGEDVDDEGLEGLELITGMIVENNEPNEVNNEINSPNNKHIERSDDSDSSDIENEIDQQKINYRHLLLIAKVIGYPPKEFTENARLYYNRQDRLKNNPDVTPISIQDLLATNYNFDEQSLAKIEEFLLLGLKYIPEERVTAKQALSSEWLQV